VIDLTDEEQENVRAAMRFLRVRAGGWKGLAPALGFAKRTLINVKLRIPAIVNAAIASS
jgi:hypothetical protein